MKEKSFLKVVATLISGEAGSRLGTAQSRGIVKLKNDQSVIDFVTSFLAERGVVSFTLNQRDNDTWATSPLMYLASNPKLVLTYTFTKFPSSDLGFYSKDLSEEEKNRDFKTLKRFL